MFRADIGAAEPLHVVDTENGGERRQCLHAAMHTVVSPAVQHSVGHRNVSAHFAVVKYRSKAFRGIARSYKLGCVDIIDGAVMNVAACSICIFGRVGSSLFVLFALGVSVGEHVRQVVELDRHDRLG